MPAFYVIYQSFCQYDVWVLPLLNAVGTGVHVCMLILCSIQDQCIQLQQAYPGRHDRGSADAGLTGFSPTSLIFLKQDSILSLSLVSFFWSF
jgi:hypothetical protein